LPGFSWPKIFFSCRLLKSLSHSFGRICTIGMLPTNPPPPSERLLCGIRRVFWHRPGISWHLHSPAGNRTGSRSTVRQQALSCRVRGRARS
jgi:hypothetical protein